jgi:hypothetical protein
VRLEVGPHLCAPTTRRTLMSYSAVHDGALLKCVKVVP